MIKKYRPKSIVIEAVQWDERPATLYKMNQNGFNQTNYRNKIIDVPLIIKDLFIETPEGNMHVKRDDYIIKGIKGEIYTCKHEIFEQIYEEIYEKEI